MTYIIISIPVILYVFVWTYFIFGFVHKKANKKNNKLKELSISIIIPFRNEIKRIAPLLACIDQLDSSNCQLKIVFIDDHSDDDGVEYLISWKRKTNKSVQIIQLENSDQFGKKTAIKKGIDQSSNDWILTLDADSLISKSFLQEFIKEIRTKKEVYLLPVMEKTNGFILSVIESYMLSIITYASARNGNPLLANGTGLIFRRSLFLNINPYEGNYHIASGDDLFLLEKILNKIPGTIQPLKNKKLIIRTDSPESYTHMLRRSCRWVGKMSQSNLKKTKAIGLMVLLCNLSLILILIFQILDNNFKIIWVILALKFFIDMLLFSLAIKNYRDIQLILKAPIVFLFYPIHLIFVIGKLLFNDQVWKGRKI